MIQTHDSDNNQYNYQVFMGFVCVVFILKCSQIPSILEPIIGTLPQLFASQTPQYHTGSRRIFIPLAYATLYSYNN